MSYELINADCLGSDGMPSLLARSVDVVISDPPYSEHVHSKSMRATVNVVSKRAPKPGDRIAEPRDLGFAPLTQDVMEAAADQFERLARRWVLVFCDVESSHLWAGALRSAGLQYIRTMAWQKLGAAPQFTGDRPGTAFEAIVVAHRPGKKQWNGGGKLGWYAVPTAQDRGDHPGLDERMHTAQKPAALMEALARDFTNPGETILDAFAGSGTTLLAALRLGRHSIGYEKNAVEHAKALLRLQGEKQLPDGFLEERQGSLSL